MNSDAPPFDPELATELVGKHLLVGLTYVRYSGEVIEQQQLHGIVEVVNATVILIRLPSWTITRPDA